MLVCLFFERRPPNKCAGLGTFDYFDETNPITDKSIQLRSPTQIMAPAGYLTIIPLTLMGSESIAHEAEAQGPMGYWLRAHEGERNNCFSKIQLVGQKYLEKKLAS